ncbi:MAG: hypothetical protein NUV84_05720 [Candidatus Uhrbacteria bacterium]|nr:hypothetical protein [Candidatus Uhrbacteria bacterium]
MAIDPTKKEGLNKVPEIKEVPNLSERAPEVEIGQPAAEKSVEVAPQSESTPMGEVPKDDQLVTTRKAPAAPAQIDRLEEEIDDILEEDLKELYVAMPPDKQAEFRQKGEETRSKIRALLSSAKVNAKKVFALIRGWLKIIPGVNRFFLEQEAKIKTDKILLVTQEEKKRNPDL